MYSRMASLAPPAAAAGLVVVVTAAVTGCGPARDAGQHKAAASPPSTGQSSAGQSSAGQPPAGQSRPPPAAQGWVCADPAAVAAVQVARIPSLSQLGQSKPLPRTVPRITVRDPAKARALARAVCGLPAMPHGVLSCPINVGRRVPADLHRPGAAPAPRDHRGDRLRVGDRCWARQFRRRTGPLGGAHAGVLGHVRSPDRHPGPRPLAITACARAHPNSLGGGGLRRERR